ncbi:voltage-gated potassium channel [Peribacillus deserti]|uniref:Voltage-gated potassium channel n=1 Tax=Peribacillus deserti TaxID=673318 RepID=A0ABS2QMI2_9BACI|nr:potassium channel family protein [Peribacillus deserti]MBM7694389.1 voltage-gated potassium channel [Peribacillus deserti]
MIRPNLNEGYVRPIRIVTLAAAAVLIAAVFGTAIHFIEPYTFPSVFEGIWWALVTASTVGYGDFAPVTPVGRVLGMILIITGIGLFTTYITTLASAAVTSQANYLTGKKAFTKNGHYIIIGWNERSRQTIIKLRDAEFNNRIVLIDNTLEINPFKDHVFHFIRGNGSHDDVLKRANISEASTVLITSGQSKDEYQSDTFTVMCLLAINGLNPGVRCIAEILTEEQTENAKRAGADIILKTNSVLSSVMERSLINSENSSVVVDRLIPQLQVECLSAPPEFEQKRIDEVKELLLKKQYILIGIKKGAEVEFTPLPNYIVEQEDQIIAGRF